IEMGLAEDWQATLATELADRDGVILNPRRDDWDASWTQSIDDAQFRGQVTWELDGLDCADVIAMWFAPDTKAPITLLELGLHIRSGRVVVGCPDGFWRKGNIEVVCKRFGATLCGDWTSFVAAVERQLAAS
ncbi:MAG TPA: nucleoside 2-deoxyribosyltransferase domain-containing protein, partial [Polyangiaceae bacterium]|nr:nucleoside 2-deoxyribosyltransferase domain-containing protein [Polyangiaceae bacterium]